MNLQSPNKALQFITKDDRTSQEDGQKKHLKEFYKEEFNRLKKSLKKESDKIVKPPIKEHIPYVFNNLDPYYNVSDAQYLIAVQREAQRRGYVTRQTAIALCEPWEDLRMDRQTFFPRVEASRVLGAEQARPVAGTEQKERPPREGATRVPRLPTVKGPADKFGRRTLYHNDVPAIRQELKKKYSSKASAKSRDDYARTKQDFYRLDLDQMDEVHPASRHRIKSTYFAYLQNTPGSRRAVVDCVQALDKQATAKPAESHLS